MVTWAFQVFASGQWTTTQLHRELIRRGLTSPPSPRRRSKPIGMSTVHRILTNPYYKGDVRYKGVTFKGAHEPIVPREVWYQVQSVLDCHKSAADATQVHDHYLKGTVYCGQCGSRLIICNTRNKQGNIYPYFVCSGRYGGKGDCSRQAMLIKDVERLIEGLYETIQISGDTRQNVAGMMHAQFDRLMASETKELARLTKDRDRLDGERTKLLQAHYAGAVPLDLLKKEQDRISAELEVIQNRLTAHHDEYAAARANLDDSLGLLAHVADIYRRCDDANRRLCNQAFFTAISIDEDGEPQVAYQHPYDALCDPQVQGNALSWATEAKKKGEVQTGTRAVPLVASSHLTHLG